MSQIKCFACSLSALVFELNCWLKLKCLLEPNKADIDGGILQQ